MKPLHEFLLFSFPWQRETGYRDSSSTARPDVSGIASEVCYFLLYEIPLIKPTCFPIPSTVPAAIPFHSCLACPSSESFYIGRRRKRITHGTQQPARICPFCHLRLERHDTITYPASRAVSYPIPDKFHPSPTHINDESHT